MENRDNLRRVFEIAVFAILCVTILCGSVLCNKIAKAENNAEKFELDTLKECRIITSPNTKDMDDILEEDPMETRKIEMAILQCVEDFRNGADKDALTQTMGYDYEYVVRVVMAEAGGEDEELQRAICQCIKNACIQSGGRLSPYDVAVAGYAAPDKQATDQVWHVCNDMFIRCDTYTPVEDAVYVYNANMCQSKWHESQEYVTSLYAVNGDEIRFFREAG